MRKPSAAARAGLREIFTGAAIRAIAGLVDLGENLLAKVGNADGDDHLDTEGGADVWIHYMDTLGGLPGIARLYIPGNILFAMPRADESAMVVRPGGASGPGIAYLLHGDGGVADRIPDWIRTKVGLFVKDKILRIESKDEAVEVNAGGDVVLQNGSLKVARDTDPIARNVQLESWMTQVETAINALASGAVTPFEGSHVGTIDGGAEDVKA
jgi:hypothetical protein